MNIKRRPFETSEPTTPSFIHSADIISRSLTVGKNGRTMPAQYQAEFALCREFDLPPTLLLWYQI
jgi:hypothetical protein